MDDRTIAAVLIREWWTFGRMLDVLAATGTRVHQLETAPLPAFLPRDLSAYYKHKMPRLVRECLPHIYPKLNDWLLRRDKMEDCIPAIDQIVRLKAPETFKPDKVFDDEYYRDRRRYVQARTVEALISAQGHTHARSAWGTIKATGRNKRR